MLQTTRRIILSGTPIQNDLEEFYTMCVFVNPGVLGDLATFKQVFMNPISRGREPTATEEEKRLGAARSMKLLETTKLFVLRRTADILEQYLPPKIENVVFCAPTQLQTELYECYLQSSDVYNILQANGSASPLEAIMNLRKMCNHPSLSYQNIMEVAGPKAMAKISNSNELNKDLYQPQYSGKLLVLEKMLLHFRENTTDRVVLVSLFRKTLDIFEKMCQHHKFMFLRLDGTVPNNKRQSLVDAFNDKGSKSFLFLLSSKAGGVGFNLVGANRIILFDGDWNPGMPRVVYVCEFMDMGFILFVFNE